jgi:hypothetical protein
MLNVNLCLSAFGIWNFFYSVSISVYDKYARHIQQYPLEPHQFCCQTAAWKDRSLL